MSLAENKREIWASMNEQVDAVTYVSHKYQDSTSQQKTAQNMCTSIVTQFSCGHNIWHHQSRCAPEDWASKCQKKKIRRRARDTCAECDPGVQTKMAQLMHDQQRADVVELYRAAKAKGDEAEMARLEAKTVRDAQTAREVIFKAAAAARRKGDVDADVAWEEV
jgi:hypothetical protein